MTASTLPGRTGLRPDASPSGPLVAPATPPAWTSHELLGSQGQAHILHGDQVYRLRLTALGKLILTK